MAKTRWLITALVAYLLALIASPTMSATTGTACAQSSIRWEASIDGAKRTAAQSNKLVLVLFTAPQWCIACRGLETDLNSQPTVGQAIEANYVAVKINADYYPNTAKQYNVKALPTTIVIAPTARGEVLDVIPQRLPLDQYLGRLNRVAEDSRRRGGALAQLSAPGPQPGPAIASASGASAASYMPSADTARRTLPANLARTANPPIAAPTVMPPTGLDGYCPVRMVESSVWTPGQKAYGAVHRGRTYLFAGEAERARFMANPDRYAPVCSGSDIVLQIEQGRTVQGTREHGVQYHGHVFLFADDASLARFSANPKFYSERALEASSRNLPTSAQVR